MNTFLPFFLACASLFAAGGGMQQFAITDPVLRMRAFSMNVPAGWSMAGTMVQGSSCNSAVSPAFRLASPDGMTGLYLQPRLDWGWASDPRYPLRQGQDCMPWTVVTAKQVLDYTIGVLKVGYVRDLEAPNRAQMQANMAELNAKSRGVMMFTGDVARALVSYEINGRRIDESLTVTMNCNVRTVPGPRIELHNCSVFITRGWAPAGKLEQMEPAFNAMAASEQFNPQWNETLAAVQAKRIRDLYAGQTAAMLAQGERAQAQRMQAHREYQAVQQRGADMRTQRFKEGQYVKQRVSDDRVDHLLDCQRFADGTTTGNCPNRQTAPRY